MMATVSAGSPAMGSSRGPASVGRRSDPELAKGRRYSACSSGVSVRRMALGSSVSMKKFSSSTTLSASGERSMPMGPWRSAGKSSQVGKVVGMASMKAMAFTLSGFLLAQWKPMPEPQSWRMRVTLLSTPRAWSRAKVYLLFSARV